MKMKILAAAVLISTTSVANAGFFSSLFGGEDDAPVEKAKTAIVTPAVTTEASSTMDSVKNVASGLLPSLTQKLGVTDTQAEGGMGSLMQMAKGALSASEFSELSDSVPNMSTLLAAAPLLTSNDSGDGMKDMLASAGGVASSLSGIATLTEQFKSLGLSSDMIAKFAEVAMSYFSNDSSNAGSLLQKGLGSILG